MPFNLSEIAKKLTCFILIVVCLGLPVISVFSFAVVFIAGLALVNSKTNYSSMKLFAAILIAIFVFMAKAMLPHAAIQEGHNILFIKGSGEVLEKELPPEVYSFMNQQFLKRYPLDKRNYSDSMNCWQVSEAPKSLFVFSADSVFSHPKYSRIVDSIDFDNLTEFRGGFANSSEYNWYGAAEIKRDSMPFFVMYELSPASVNSSLYWTGFCLWEDRDGHYQSVYNETEGCRMITALDVGKKVFGVAVSNKEQAGFRDRFREARKQIRSFFSGKKITRAPEEIRETPLSMKLVLSPALRLSAILKRGLELLGAFFILSLLVRVDRKRFLIALFIIATAAVITYLYCPSLFGQYHIHEGGEDGMTHETLGRKILLNAINGNWAQAIRGEQDVFWDTPGFRYFRALEKLFFGDTSMAYLAVTLILPYVLFGFLTMFISKIWSFWITVLFTLGISPHISIWKNPGIAYYMYIMVSRGGWPDTLAYTAFLGGITLALRYIKMLDGAYLWYGFLAHLLLFVTVFMRPQFCVAALVVVLYLAARLMREGRIKEVLFTWIGFAPVLFPLFHNYIFGGKICLFTGSMNSAIDTPPSIYLGAFRELLTLNFMGKNLTQVATHLKLMIGPWYRPIFLAAVFYMAFLKKKVPPDMRMIAIVCLSLHFVNLFIFAVSFRYVLLTWMLTIVITIFLVWLLLKERKDNKLHV